MKITINQNNLRKGLLITEKIVTRNISLPILNNILLKTENGRLRMSSTNLEIGINFTIGAKIDEIGEITVPVKILSDFVAGINDEKINLITKNNILYINSNNYKTNILGFDSKDFPIIPKIKRDPILSIPPKLLKNSLLSVFDSILISETRPELSGVFVNLNKNKVLFVSTDIFRLSEKIIDLKSNQLVSFIIPRNLVTELIRVCGDIDDDLDLRISDNQISFSNNNFEIVSKLIDGNYPDYKKVIPDKSLSSFLVNKNELEKHIRLAGIFSSNIYDVKIQTQNDRALIIAQNSNKGDIEISLPIKLKNSPFEISLNYQYLLDGIKNIQSDNVSICFTGEGSPLVIKPDNNIGDFIYIIMPLRK